tara:strand:+ start:749 stop:949 length:201 start_codon:yes stop_codon:yes gene_type:complete
MKTQEQYIRDKWPERAKKAANGSRKEAIALFCINCIGGSSQEARKCTSTECFLWNFRPGSNKKEDN